MSNRDSLPGRGLIDFMPMDALYCNVIEIAKGEWMFTGVAITLKALISALLWIVD